MSKKSEPKSKPIWWTKKSKDGRYLIRGCIGRKRVLLIQRGY